MRLIIEIRTANSAFEEDPAGEVARLLRDYVNRIERRAAIEYQAFVDMNGNTVGFVIPEFSADDHIGLRPYDEVENDDGE